MDEVISGYRTLKALTSSRSGPTVSGKAERYRSQQEILNTVQEFREKPTRQYCTGLVLLEGETTGVARDSTRPASSPDSMIKALHDQAFSPYKVYDSVGSKFL